MTRKHFKAIADAIHFANVPAKHKRAMAEALASTFPQFNGRFDRSKFVRVATEQR